MASSTINVLVTSFPGLGLPPTLSLPLAADATLKDLTCAIEERIPPVNNRLLLTTNANKLVRSSSSPITTLLPKHDATFLPLRLSAPLCGGKGGFGSQLRAAGGRMSSRKKNGERNSSARNLDGRRLRTVTEAKALAEYLAVKPEMDRKEKEERRKRWEQVVEATEKREEEVKSGRDKGKVDEEWVEQKERAESGARDDILRALKAGDIKNVLGNVEESGSGSGETSEDGSESEDDVPAKADMPPAKGPGRAFFGWDEDEDEDFSEEDDEQVGADVAGKGKAKAWSVLESSRDISFPFNLSNSNVEAPFIARALRSNVELEADLHFPRTRVIPAGSSIAGRRGLDDRNVIIPHPRKPAPCDCLYDESEVAATPVDAISLLMRRFKLFPVSLLKLFGLLFCVTHHAARNLFLFQCQLSSLDVIFAEHKTSLLTASNHPLQEISDADMESIMDQRGCEWTNDKINASDRPTSPLTSQAMAAVHESPAKATLRRIGSNMSWQPPLLRLPGELRNRIYFYVFRNTSECFKRRRDLWYPSDQPSVLLVCQRLRTEALPLWYASINIVFDIGSGPRLRSQASTWLTRFATYCQYITCFIIHVRASVREVKTGEKRRMEVALTLSLFERGIKFEGSIGRALEDWEAKDAVGRMALQRGLPALDGTHLRDLALEIIRVTGRISFQEYPPPSKYLVHENKRLSTYLDPGPKPSHFLAPSGRLTRRNVSYFKHRLLEEVEIIPS